MGQNGKIETGILKFTDEKLIKAICVNDVDYLENYFQTNDINHRLIDEDNDTLISYAIGDNDSDAYKFLLMKKPNLDLVNNEGESIIHSIVFSGQPNRIDEVFALNQININKRDSRGATPLLLATSLDKFEIVKKLFHYNADCNIADNEGLTPLHCACMNGNIEMVKLITKKKANLFAKTEKGNLGLAFAVNENYIDIVKYLYGKMYIG